MCFWCKYSATYTQSRDRLGMSMLSIRNFRVMSKYLPLVAQNKSRRARLAFPGTPSIPRFPLPPISKLCRKKKESLKIIVIAGRSATAGGKKYRLLPHITHDPLRPSLKQLLEDCPDELFRGYPEASQWTRNWNTSGIVKTLQTQSLATVLSVRIYQLTGAASNITEMVPPTKEVISIFVKAGLYSLIDLRYCYEKIYLSQFRLQIIFYRSHRNILAITDCHPLPQDALTVWQDGYYIGNSNSYRVNNSCGGNISPSYIFFTIDPNMCTVSKRSTRLSHYRHRVLI